MNETEMKELAFALFQAAYGVDIGPEELRAAIERGGHAEALRSAAWAAVDAIEALRAEALAFHGGGGTQQ